MVKRRRGGHKAKDAEIVDGFNPVKKGAPGIREIEKGLQEKIDEVQKKLEAKKKKDEKKPKKTEKADETPVDINDKAATYQMLADMRSVYQKAGGAKKLLKLVKADDKTLLMMVKELMKVETSLIATEIRNKDNSPGAGNQVTFVILKGLQDEDTVMKIKGDGAIDLEQVADAINPSSVPKIEYQEEMVRPE